MGEDDIFLLRLMSITGPCLMELDEDLSARLMVRIALILKSGFLAKASLPIFEEVGKLGAFPHMGPTEQRFILDTLTKIESRNQGSQVAAKASKVYTQLGKQSGVLYGRG